MWLIMEGANQTEGSICLVSLCHVLLVFINKTAVWVDVLEMEVSE